MTSFYLNKLLLMCIWDPNYFNGPSNAKSFFALFLLLLSTLNRQSTQQKASRSLYLIKYTLVTSIQTTEGHEVSQESPWSPSADRVTLC